MLTFDSIVLFFLHTTLCPFVYYLLLSFLNFSSYSIVHVDSKESCYIWCYVPVLSTACNFHYIFLFNYLCLAFYPIIPWQPFIFVCFRYNETKSVVHDSRHWFYVGFLLHNSFLSGILSPVFEVGFELLYGLYDTRLLKPSWKKPYGELEQKSW